MRAYFVLFSSLLFLLLSPQKAQSVDTDFQEWLLEKLILAGDGETIYLPAGRYSLDAELSITASNVTLKGQGMDETVLSFKESTSGSEALLVTASGITLEDFTIEDSKGDGIKVVRADGITFRRIRVLWSKGPHTDNGAYGIYPVQSKNVLVEYCEVFSASDAGIYVGQSQNIMVRRNTVKFNVAGIEIENSKDADVYDNEVHENTGGILVFNLPSLAVFGEGTRVYQNNVTNNNTENFAAPTNMVASVPQGTGIMIMANRSVEIYDNLIKNHQTASILMVGFASTGNQTDDTRYNPYVERIFIYNNKILESGYNPIGGSSPLSKASIEALKNLLSLPLPDIIFDGDKREGADPENAICIKDNEGLSFVDLDIQGDFSNLSRDLSSRQCQHGRLQRVYF